METRILKSTDSIAYQKLRLNALKTNPEAFGSTYEREVKFTEEEIIKRIQSDQNNFFIGVFEGEDLVGVVSFHRENGEKFSHKGGIYGMFVHPIYRNKGIGKLLLKNCIDQVRGNCPDLEQINLTVVADNEAGVKLYQSLGFTCYGLEKRALKYEGKYYDEALMVLFL